MLEKALRQSPETMLLAEPVGLDAGVVEPPSRLL